MMAQGRQYGVPHLLSGSDEPRDVRTLERITLGKQASYDERWLQRLIHEHPQLLPAREIESSFTQLVPVCIELPMPAGFLDNLYLTPEGGIVLGECKLWRNPEARRQVVAQAIDYASCLVGWKYEDLEAAIGKAQLPDGSRPPRSLWERLREETDLEEAEFIDSVSRNLRLGRALVMIVGDGIREGMESLADYLQVHAGLHFTLALAEMALYQMPDAGGILVQPRVLARTLNIDRGIVRIDESRACVMPVEKPRAGASSYRRTTISEEVFFEELARRDPELPDRVRGFLEKLEPLGVQPQMRRSLILRWMAPDGTPFNLGYFYPNEDLHTDVVNWKARRLGLLELSHEYLHRLARAIGGEVDDRAKDGNWFLTLNGQKPKISTMLDHQDAWVEAIEWIVTSVSEALEEQE